MTAPRTILHVDMDAFFASVEQRDNPVLRGKPVLVGGTGRRGVVSTASYEARPYGCRSAMPMAQALRLCPHAVVVHGNFEAYGEASRQVRAILERFTPDIEPLSIDEAFMDVTGSRRLHGDGRTIAQAIRRMIRDEVGLTASVGVAPNKFLAKVASDMNKPDGLAEIAAESAASVLAPMPVGVIFGVGPGTVDRLEHMGVRTIADLRALGEPRLVQAFGESGSQWWRLAYGLDDRPVHTEHTAKSIGKERTFSNDIADPERLRAVLLEEVESVSRLLREDGLLARRVSVKLRTPDFRTFTRAATLDRPTDQTAPLAAAARAVLDQWLAGRPCALRLLGVQLQGLFPPPPPGLFEQGQAPERPSRIDAAADAIVERFGQRAIARARTIEAARLGHDNPLTNKALR